MTKKEYNGWTNYETWAVALWLGNDEQSQGYWQEMAAEALNCEPEPYLSIAESATYQLAKQLQDNHEQALPEINGFASDLLNAAMSEVNWNEIAKGYVEQAIEANANA